jgi:tetratricopeptide (TPR) repeat protein
VPTPEPAKPATAEEAAPTPPPTSPDDEARTAALAKVKDWRDDLVKLTSRLTARQSELIRLGVTEDVGEVTKSLAALTGVNQALSKASDKLGSLTKDEVEARMAELEVQVDEASYTAYALVGKPLPTADELDARKRRQDLAQRAAYDAEDLEKAFSALESPLKTRSDEWKQAQRSDKTAEFDALLGSVEKSKTDLAAFKPKLASASEDELSRTMEAIKKSKDDLSARSQALLAEKVVSAKDLDEQKKLEAAKRAKAAETAAAQKTTQKAAAGAQTAAAAMDDADARAKNLADQADAMFNSGKYPTAIGLYKQALRIKDRTDIHLNLGKSYNSVGNYPEGAKHLKIYLQRMAGKLSPVKEQLIRRQIRE